MCSPVHYGIVPSLLFEGLSIIVFLCLGLRNGKAICGELLPSCLSLGKPCGAVWERPPSCLCPGGHADPTYRECPPSRLCPGSPAELSQGGEQLLCVKHLLFLVLLLVILLLLLGVPYSKAVCFQEIVTSTHSLCLCPSLIRRGRGRGVAYLESNFLLVLNHFTISSWFSYLS